MIKTYIYEHWESDSDSVMSIAITRKVMSYISPLQVSYFRRQMDLRRSKENIEHVKVKYPLHEQVKKYIGDNWLNMSDAIMARNLSEIIGAHIMRSQITVYRRRLGLNRDIDNIKSVGKIRTYAR